MKSQKYAINILLGLLSLVILFHCLIITSIIPYEITWGGRLTSEKEMYVFETFSILLNLFFVWILLMKAQYVRIRFHKKVIKCLLWFFLFLFIVNTIGNIFAETTIEKMFSILTFAFSILLWIILGFRIGPEPKKLKS